MQRTTGQNTSDAAQCSFGNIEKPERAPFCRLGSPGKFGRTFAAKVDYRTPNNQCQMPGCRESSKNSRQGHLNSCLTKTGASKLSQYASKQVHRTSEIVRRYLNRRQNSRSSESVFTSVELNGVLREMVYLAFPTRAIHLPKLTLHRPRVWTREYAASRISFPRICSCFARLCKNS
jgi:hypothetical protein